MNWVEIVEYCWIENEDEYLEDEYLEEDLVMDIDEDDDLEEDGIDFFGTLLQRHQIDDIKIENDDEPFQSTRDRP